jgi:hypothetical protein
MLRPARDGVGGRPGQHDEAGTNPTQRVGPPACAAAATIENEEHGKRSPPVAPHPAGWLQGSPRERRCWWRVLGWSAQRGAAAWTPSAASPIGCRCRCRPRSSSAGPAHAAWPPSARPGRRCRREAARCAGPHRAGGTQRVGGTCRMHRWRCGRCCKGSCGCCCRGRSERRRRSRRGRGRCRGLEWPTRPTGSRYSARRRWRAS